MNPLYLIPYNILSRVRPPHDYWSTARLTPIILIPGHSTLLYNPNVTKQTIAEAIRDILLLIGPTQPFYTVFWATNTLKSTLLYPWSDEAGWTIFLERVSWLNQSLESTKCLGVLLDLENYYFTPNLSGGKMREGAWPNHSNLIKRATDYAKSFSPNLQLGGYVWSPEIRRHDGLRLFLNTVNRTRKKKGLLLGEDYVGSSDTNAAKLTYSTYIRGYQGRYPPKKKNKDYTNGWIWDPKEVLI